MSRGHNMRINYDQLIREHIKRMRSHCVEPELVLMCYECWDSLGKPNRFLGVPVDCDSYMSYGFEVR